MSRQSMIKALRISVAAGYMAGGVGSAIVLVNTGNRSLLLLAAMPAVLQSIETAARWATGNPGDRHRGDDRLPEQRLEENVLGMPFDKSRRSDVSAIRHKNKHRPLG